MGKRDQETFEFDCELKSSTPNAYLLVIDGRDVWVARSIAEFVPSSDDEVIGTIELPQWLIDKEGLG